MRGQDLLTALADELKGLGPELAQAYDSGTDAGASSRASNDASYVTSVARLSEAAGYMGLAGVQRICASVLENLAPLYLPSGIRYSVPFLVLIAILLVRPAGLLGRVEPRKV